MLYRTDGDRDTLWRLYIDLAGPRSEFYAECIIMPHSSPTSPTTSDTQAACPTCRRPVLDTDLGDVLTRVRADLAHLTDLVELVIEELREPMADDDYSM